MPIINHKLHSLDAEFSEVGELQALRVRVNRDLQDAESGRVVGLPTSGPTSIMEIYTPEEQAQLAALLLKGHRALPTLDYGD